MKLYDSKKLFELNPEMVVEKVDIEGHTLVKISDFYKNFDYLLDFVNNLPVDVSFKTDSEFDLYGYRSHHKDFQMSDQVKKKLEEVLQVPVKLFVTAFNYYTDIDSFKQNLIPHRDGGARTLHSTAYAGVLYLDKNIERNGTGIFKFKNSKNLKPTDVEYMLTAKYRRDRKYTLATSSDDIWDLVYESEGEPNSLFLYPAYLLHSPMLSEDTYESGREVQVFFINVG